MSAPDAHPSPGSPSGPPADPRSPTTGSTPIPAEVERATRRLRTVLRLNAAFSTVTGVVALVAGGPVADLLGVDQVWLIRLLGAGLLAFAAAVVQIARSEPAALRQGAAAVSVGDLGWVLGTVVVVAVGWLSTAGVVVMAVIAVLVLDFGIGQYLARRQMGPAVS